MEREREKQQLQRAQAELQRVEAEQSHTGELSQDLQPLNNDICQREGNIHSADQQIQHWEQQLAKFAGCAKVPALGTSLEGYGVASLLPKRKGCAYFVATLVCLVPFVAVLVQLILVYVQANPFPFATLFRDSMAITCYASE
uniref:Uncharacterized protein n=1 Tax=Dunaliella tertiolecta TaxID=3047 RepID=A0A6S8HRI4_DUNTE|mmetsp:Transcript_21383/g.55670  ORF Transcript_21383/g.55670 Transcript_21383/m.55670 type:complete len:142 (-) Transcript_21383:117-542(-)